MNERILNLLSLCMQAKEKGHDCFFNYSPHINEIEIQIHKGGWTNPRKDENDQYIKGSSNLTIKFSFKCAVKDSHNLETALNILGEVEDYLKGLI